MRRNSDANRESRVSNNLSYSSSRLSSISRVSDLSQKSQLHHMHTLLKMPQPTQTQNYMQSTKASNGMNAKSILPPKPNSMTSPYFPASQQIFCVICKKSYKVSELSSHLLLHKQSQPASANIQSSSIHLTPSKSQSSLLSSKCKSISKFKQTPVQSSPIPSTFSIASSIPANQKTCPPVPQTIFQPGHLGIDNQCENVCYQQEYLNPQKYSLKKHKKKDEDLESLFDLLSMRSSKIQSKRSRNFGSPMVVYDSQMQKTNDNRNTGTGDRLSLSEIASLRSLRKKAYAPC